MPHELDISNLTPAERLALIDRLWDSLNDHDVPVPPSARERIWEKVEALTADIPEDEWDKLPADLAEQHNHYLYGTPKRPA